MSTRRYFAYGSNLDATDRAAWSARRGAAYDAAWFTPIARGHVTDRALAFTTYSSGRAGGVLDIPPQRLSAAWGLVFDVHDAAWEWLDRKEDVGRQYERIDVLVHTDDGRALRAGSYQVMAHNRSAHVPPGDAYVEVVGSGLSAHGLGRADLDRARTGAAAVPTTSLFVYGTLLRGERNHHVLDASAVRTTVAARARGALMDLGPYPALVLDDTLVDGGAQGGAHAEVHGELVTLDPARPDSWDALDALEGIAAPGDVRNLYERRLIDVDVAGARVQAWTYVMIRAPAGATRIDGGDWRTRPALAR